MNAEQKRADSDAMRRSHAHASARPPPNAAPFTAAMTICGVSWRCCVRFARNALAAHTGVPMAMRSDLGRHAVVVQVEPGAEGCTRTGEDRRRGTSSSAAISSSASCSSPTSAKFNALRWSGRFNANDRDPLGRVFDRRRCSSLSACGRADSGLGTRRARIGRLEPLQESAHQLGPRRVGSAARHRSRRASPGRGRRSR